MRILRLRILLCLSIACTASLNPTGAAAAPAVQQADDDPTVAIARERFKEGVAFFDKKDFEKARLAFLQAYALKKHPAVLLNLAQSELRSGHEADAAKHFSTYLRDATEASPAEAQAAAAGLSTAKLALAEVEVDVDDSGAEVYVDGSLEGSSPLPGPLYLAVGSHNVEARKDGKSTATQINASAGKQLRAALTLNPSAVTPAAPPPPAPVAEPAAAPAEEPPVASSGRKPFFKWLVSSPVGLVGLTLTGAGLGTGIGFAVASGKSYSNSDSVTAQINSAAVKDSGQRMPDTANLCNDPKAWLARIPYPSNAVPDLDGRAAEYSHACSLYPDNVHKGDTYKAISAVGFVASGLAAIGTVVWYFVDPSAKDTHSETAARRAPLALVPSFGAGQTGLSVLGSF